MIEARASAAAQTAARKAASGAGKRCGSGDLYAMMTPPIAKASAARARCANGRRVTGVARHPRSNNSFSFVRAGSGFSTGSRSR